MLFVPEAVTAIREGRKLSKSKLAVAAQITVSYVSELEAGNRLNPSLEVVQRLANALDCEPEAFYVRRSLVRDFVRSNPGQVLGWIDGDDEVAA